MSSNPVRSATRRERFRLAAAAPRPIGRRRHFSIPTPPLTAAIPRGYGLLGPGDQSDRRRVHHEPPHRRTGGGAGGRWATSKGGARTRMRMGFPSRFATLTVRSPQWLLRCRGLLRPRRSPHVADHDSWLAHRIRRGETPIPDQLPTRFRIQVAAQMRDKLRKEGFENA